MFLSFLLINCGGNGNISKKNEHLGEIPYIVKDNIEKVEAKEKEIKECTDFDKEFKLKKELKLIKEENRDRIAKYVSSSKIFGKELPFEAINNDIFILDKVIIDTVFENSGRIQFKFILKIKDEITEQRYTPIIYFKAVDKQGKDIAEAKSVAAGYRSNISVLVVELKH